MKNQLEQGLPAVLHIAKIPQNSLLKFELDKSNAWTAELLKELNENASEKTPEEWLAETDIKLEIELTKRFKGEWGEFLLVKGYLTADYVTESVVDLKTMREGLDIDFQICFAEAKLLDTEEFKDVHDTWQDGETWELYPYQNQQVDIAEMVHEQAYLHYNAYPGLEADPSENASDDEEHYS